MSKKLNIGCATVGDESKIGDMIQVIVVATPEFFRKHIPKINVIPYALKAEHLFIKIIPPENFTGEQQMINGVMELLNTYPEFWEYQISILTHIDRKEFVDRLQLTEGLKKVGINFDKWNFINNDHDYIPKVCQLAKKVAEYHRNQNIDYIKTVYGDYNSESEFIEKNPGIIHIRK